MRLLIGHTLEHSTRFRVDYVGNVIPPEPYADFARQISNIRQKKPVTIITFNYDIALDAALELAGIPVDYSLDQNLSGGASVPVIKLHGSINWGRCMACKSSIIPFHMRDFLKRFPGPNWPTDSSGQNASIILLADDVWNGAKTSRALPFGITEPFTRNRSADVGENESQCWVLRTCGNMQPDRYLKPIILLSLGTHCHPVINFFPCCMP